MKGKGWGSDDENWPIGYVKRLESEKRVRESLGLVFVSGDSEQEAVLGGTILEAAHGSGTVGGLRRTWVRWLWWCARPFVCRGYGSKSGEEIVEIVTQAFDGGGVRGFPDESEAACCRAGLGEF